MNVKLTRWMSCVDAEMFWKWFDWSNDQERKKETIELDMKIFVNERKTNDEAENACKEAKMADKPNEKDEGLIHPRISCLKNELAFFIARNSHNDRVTFCVWTVWPASSSWRSCRRVFRVLRQVLHRWSHRPAARATCDFRSARAVRVCEPPPSVLLLPAGLACWPAPE